MTNKKIALSHKFTLFVDDVREETRGKVSLIGLYGNDIVLDNLLPLLLPKFCIVTRFGGVDGEFIATFSFKDPDGEDVLTENGPISVKIKKDELRMLNVIVSPFVIKKEGEYKFSLFLDNKEFHTASIMARVRLPEN